MLILLAIIISISVFSRFAVKWEHERVFNRARSLLAILYLCLFCIQTKGQNTYCFKNIPKDTIVYCNEPVLLFPELVLEGDGPIPSINVHMVEGYDFGDDLIIQVGHDPDMGTVITADFDYENFRVVCGQTVKQWVTFLRNLRFRCGTHAIAKPGIRKIVLQIDRLPLFYQTLPHSPCTGFQLPGPASSCETDTLIIDVRAIPFDIKREYTICKGDSIRLNRKDTLATYLWSPSKTLSSETKSNPMAGLNASEIIKNPGKTMRPLIFNIKDKLSTTIGLRMVSSYGCEGAAGTVSLRRKPNFSLTASSTLGCAPLETTFEGFKNDKNDDLAFSWDYGDGSKDSGIKTSHTYFNPDKKYDVALSVLSKITGCSDTLVSTEMINVYPNPKAAFAEVYAGTTNDKANFKFFNQSIGAVHYSWDFKDGTMSVEESPVHGWSGTGSRRVFLESFNEYSCVDTISHSFPVAINKIFPPNAFWPNAPNPIDREFRLESEGIINKGYHFVIFNRWDVVVFEAKDEIKGWNGRLKDGSYAQPGNYIWVLDYADFLGHKHRQTGTVTLIF